MFGWRGWQASEVKTRQVVRIMRSRHSEDTTGVRSNGGKKIGRIRENMWSFLEMSWMPWGFQRC